MDDNQTRERFSGCTLLISIPLDQGKSHPDQYPPSLTIITSVGPDSSGAKEDRLKYSSSPPQGHLNLKQAHLNPSHTNVNPNKTINKCLK